MQNSLDQHAILHTFYPRVAQAFFVATTIWDGFVCGTQYGKCTIIIERQLQNDILSRAISPWLDKLLDKLFHPFYSYNRISTLILLSTHNFSADAFCSLAGRPKNVPYHFAQKIHAMCMFLCVCSTNTNHSFCNTVMIKLYLYKV